MAVYSFSTKTSRPDDTIVIERAKRICADRGLNFSALVVSLLKQWEQEAERDRRAKVQSA